MSSFPSLRDMHFESSDVGQNIKSTKKLYKWTFYLNNKMQIVDLYQSKVSGKRKVMHNGSSLYEDLSYKADFTFSFYIDKIFCNIIQIDDDRFELRIMNRAFTMLMEEERNKRNNFDDTEIENKKQIFMSKKESCPENNSVSKFEFPKYLKTSNKKSISYINDPKASNFNDNEKQVTSMASRKNVHGSLLVGDSSKISKEVLNNNNDSKKNDLINMEEIFTTSKKPANGQAPVHRKNNSDLMAQLDFLASNSNNSNNFINNNINSSLINNCNSGSINQINGQYTNSNNISSQNSNQFNPFADFDKLRGVSPNMWNNNQGTFPNEFNMNKNNIKPSLSKQENNPFDDILQPNSSENNFNEFDSKSSGTANVNDLKTKILNNTKLVDLNNLLDDKKAKKEEKSILNTPIYAYSGTPLNAIKLDPPNNNVSKFNSGDLKNGISFNMNNNIPSFNSAGMSNQGYPNQFNQGYSNQMRNGYEMSQSYNNIGYGNNNQQKSQLNKNYYPYNCGVNMSGSNNNVTFNFK